MSSKRSFKLKVLILVILVILAFTLSVGMGSVNISPQEILETLTKKGLETTNSSIIMKIRLPRALAAMVSGGALGVAGLLMQNLFNNPIVEPYVLGVSSGSMASLALVMLGGVTFGYRLTNPYLMFFAALIGALIVMLLMAVLSTRLKSLVSLLVVGLMVGYISQAITSILMAYASSEQIGQFTMKTMGSFSGFTWDEVKVLTIVTVVFILLSQFMAKDLNVMLLGESYARSMGLEVRSFRFKVIITSSVLTAVVVAFAGPISFVGLTVPHLTRLVFKTENNQQLIPLVTLAGALMTTVCDLVARTIAAPVELPLAAVTSLIGAPLLIYLIVRGRVNE